MRTCGNETEFTGKDLQVVARLHGWVYKTFKTSYIQL